MNELRSSIRSRDQIGGDDNVAIGIDTYGDGRNMIVLGSNPDGSQFDLKILPTATMMNIICSMKQRLQNMTMLTM